MRSVRSVRPVRALPPQSQARPRSPARRPAVAYLHQRRRRMVLLGLMFAIGLLAGLLSNVVGNFVIQPLQAGFFSAIAHFGAPPPPAPLLGSNGRPILSPLPAPQETWECEVVVVGGSLGGVAAASHAMEAGARTCLIELAPWIGGQVSAQGVSALDESRRLLQSQEKSDSWSDFKDVIRQQPLKLPNQPVYASLKTVEDVNSCWVGRLCFPPKAGVQAVQQWLKTAAKQAPNSRWQGNIAFKGAEFDETGRQITAIYAVRRTPRQPDYLPTGHLSKELVSWYSWSNDEVFTKTPIKLQAPAGQRMLVIDATDTGELVGWAGVPYRLGAESRAMTKEKNAAKVTNPACTQAFTYPFVLAIQDDRNKSLQTALGQIKSDFPEAEHQKAFNMEGFPMFDGKSFFNYRRIVSAELDDPFYGRSDAGDMTLVNWNQGNDWGVMNPPLVQSERQLRIDRQQTNWMGGLNTVALWHGESHALYFAKWLLQTQATSEHPLTFLAGADSPMGTQSGLSMLPYFREGRRIIGRPAYGQKEFQIREADIREDMSGARDFSKTAVALVHYAIDIHGCRDRNGGPSWEAASAPIQEDYVRPLQVPLESLIPVGVDNLLIGGKSLAVTHIANAATRVHYSEWSIGAAAGSTAGWLLQKAPANLAPADIVPQGKIGQLQAYLVSHGQRIE